MFIQQIVADIFSFKATLIKLKKTGEMKKKVAIQLSDDT